MKNEADKPRMVIYHYYTNAVVYLDGSLVGVYDGHPINYLLAKQLGFGCPDSRTVRWEQLPGYSTSGRCQPPPERLVDMEIHFANLVIKEREERIEDLKRELAELELEKDLAQEET